MLTYNLPGKEIEMPCVSIGVRTEVCLEFMGTDIFSSRLVLSEMSSEELNFLVKLLEKYGKDLLLYIKAEVATTESPSGDFIEAAKLAGVSVFDETTHMKKCVVLRKCVQHKPEVNQIPLFAVSIGLLAKTLEEMV